MHICLKWRWKEKTHTHKNKRREKRIWKTEFHIQIYTWKYDIHVQQHRNEISYLVLGSNFDWSLQRSKQRSNASEIRNHFDVIMLALAEHLIFFSNVFFFLLLIKSWCWTIVSSIRSLFLHVFRSDSIQNLQIFGWMERRGGWWCGSAPRLDPDN